MSEEIKVEESLKVAIKQNQIKIDEKSKLGLETPNYVVQGLNHYRDYSSKEKYSTVEDRYNSSLKEFVKKYAANIQNLQI